MNPSEIRDLASLAKLVEVLLFVSDQPLSSSSLLEQLTAAPEVEEGVLSPPLSVTLEDVEDALDHLRSRLVGDSNTPWEIESVSGGYRLVTKSVYAPWVRRAQLARERRRLSRAALEVLAIVAYRQPVTRAEIEYVRGVSSEYAVTRLLEKQLIEPAGRAELPGKPLLYQTTHHFLVHFGLQAPQDLPSPAELKLDPDLQETFATPTLHGQTPEA